MMVLIFSVLRRPPTQRKENPFGTSALLYKYKALMLWD